MGSFWNVASRRSGSPLAKQSVSSPYIMSAYVLCPPKPSVRKRPPPALIAAEGFTAIIAHVGGSRTETGADVAPAAALDGIP